MPAPQITHRPLATLTPWTRNARSHSTKQIRQIAASIREFGFTTPVLIDEAGTILAGHGRVAAATLLGMTEVPCLQIEHLSGAQKRAYVLADNKLARNAGWDEDLLAAELGALLATDLDLDLGVTGFSIPEVDALLATVAPEEPDDPAEEWPCPTLRSRSVPERPSPRGPGMPAPIPRSRSGRSPPAPLLGAPVYQQARSVASWCRPAMGQAGRAIANTLYSVNRYLREINLILNSLAIVLGSLISICSRSHMGHSRSPAIPRPSFNTPWTSSGKTWPISPRAESA